MSEDAPLAGGAGKNKSSGTKTPRKVQWIDSIRASSRRSDVSSNHALDEHGLDPQAFETLTDALERHRSISPLPNDENDVPVAVPRHPDLHIDTNRSSNLKTGGTSSAPAATVESFSRPVTAEYDYATDTITRTHPPSGIAFAQAASHLRSASSNTLSTTITTPDFNSESVTPLPPDVPEIPGHYIDKNERAGLPGTDDLETYAQAQASKVVRAHTQKRFTTGRLFGRGKKKGKDSKAEAVENSRGGVKSNDYAYLNAEQKRKLAGEGDKVGGEGLFRRRRKDARKRHGTDDTLSNDTDIERDAYEPPPSLIAGGGGILSALLALYDHSHAVNTPTDLSEPSTPGGGTTRSASPDPLDVYESSPSRVRGESIRSSGRDVSAHRQHKSWDVTSTFLRHSHHHQQAPPPPDSTNSRGGSSANSASRGSGLLSRRSHATPLSMLNNIAHLGEDRPVQSRNAGGVFGSLIASTGNISGAAAPASSTLAPNVTRPGYNLSRYSLEELPPLRKPGTASRGSTVDSSDSDGTHKFADSGAKSAPVSPRDESPPTLSGSGDTSVREHATTHNKSPGKWSTLNNMLKDIPKSGLRSGWNTPPLEKDAYFDEKTAMQEKERRRENIKVSEERKRKKRKKAEVYITRHVAQIIQRQEFILKLTRAFLMFGAPSHRLPAQLQATARVLDLTLSCMYLPDVVLISFEDPSTGTGQLKFIRQGSKLDLGKLQSAYGLYWKVIHDMISVSEASEELDVLMRKEQIYSSWQLILIGGMCSAWICTVSFAGSFLDALVSIPLGALLVGVQILSVRNELYSNVFEITIATLLSFLSAAIASSGKFCYSAVASSSIVLILPGFIVLCGALEISSRNIISGSVRLCYAVVYSLFLGFGLAMGAEAYQKITGIQVLGTDDTNCTISHPITAPWYQQTTSKWWAFLTVPMYSLFLSLRNFSPWNKKQLILQVVIACIGWVTNHYTSIKFVGQSDVAAAVGAFAVGIVANVYARFFKGNAFVIMITGILFQVPSGLGSGGLLTFVSQQTAGSSDSYLSSFQTALQLISVGIGLTVGLGISLVLTHPIQSKRRAAGVFSL